MNVKDIKQHVYGSFTIHIWTCTVQLVLWAYNVDLHSINANVCVRLQVHNAYGHMEYVRHVCTFWTTFNSGYIDDLFPIGKDIINKSTLLICTSLKRRLNYYVWYRYNIAPHQCSLLSLLMLLLYQATFSMPSIVYVLNLQQFIKHAE